MSPNNSPNALDEIFSALSAFVRAGERLHAAGVISDRSGVDLERWLHPVLFVVAESAPVRIGEIASQLGILESTASRQVARLQVLGYLAGRTDESDRRATQIELTKLGVETHAALHKAWTSVFADATASWSAKERDGLGSGFARFIRGVSEIAQA